MNRIVAVVSPDLESSGWLQKTQGEHKEQTGQLSLYTKTTACVLQPLKPAHPEPSRN